MMLLIFLLILPCLAADLIIDVVRSNDCDVPTISGDIIAVHYNGSLQDGTSFDSSLPRGKPIEFQLGAGQVIQGWDQGLLDMCLGDERRLTIPSSLAYGSRAIGKIPSGATLIFETRLVKIVQQALRPVDIENESKPAEGIEDYKPQEDGVKSDDSGEDDNEQDGQEEPEEQEEQEEPEEQDEQTSNGADSTAEPSATEDPESEETKTSSEPATASQQPITPPEPDDPEDPGRNAECRLLGPFALIVQASLGLLALSSLVWKRWRERPRRPFKVWFFDASKQVFGSGLLHVLNLAMSMISSADLAFRIAAIKDVNPCSWYLINIAIDTTIGIPILVILLKILNHAFALTPLARPPESIHSGHYGRPPRATWWLKQGLIYFIGLVLMKLCVFIIIQLLPWIALVGDWALRWTEGSEALQIAFVMFVFPLIMNALQYYIIDAFIKERTDSYDEPEPRTYESLRGASGEEDEQADHRKPDVEPYDPAIRRNSIGTSGPGSP